MKKIKVLYLSSKYTKLKNLKNFIYNYKKFKSGLRHELIICFKNLDFKELKKRKKILKKIKYTEYIDPSKKMIMSGEVLAEYQKNLIQVLFFI